MRNAAHRVLLRGQLPVQTHLCLQSPPPPPVPTPPTTGTAAPKGSGRRDAAQQKREIGLAKTAAEKVGQFGLICDTLHSCSEAQKATIASLQQQQQLTQMQQRVQTEQLARFHTQQAQQSQQQMALQMQQQAEHLAKQHQLQLSQQREQLQQAHTQKLNEQEPIPHANSWFFVPVWQVNRLEPDMVQLWPNHPHSGQAWQNLLNLSCSRRLQCRGGVTKKELATLQHLAIGFLPRNVRS